MNKLEVGKDYINKNGLIVIDRIGDTTNRGLDRNNFDHDLFCSSPYVWREATEEEVIKAFKKHLVCRYGEDWETMKIKERHPNSSATINNGGRDVVISKLFNGWCVHNKNGLLYYNGIWVERLEAMKDENLNTENAFNSDLGAIKPPLGLIPKKFHDKRVKAERFNEVCGAIARYYDAGMKIDIEWIQEYNELVESLGKHYR